MTRVDPVRAAAQADGSTLIVGRVLAEVRSGGMVFGVTVSTGRRRALDSAANRAASAFWTFSAVASRTRRSRISDSFPEKQRGFTLTPVIRTADTCRSVRERIVGPGSWRASSGDFRAVGLRVACRARAALGRMVSRIHLRERLRFGNARGVTDDARVARIGFLRLMRRGVVCFGM